MSEVKILIDESIYKSFADIASKNSTTPDEVLSDFIKDYVVSSGHPEKVVNRWPWNKQTR